MRANDAVILIAGDIALEDARSLAETAFARLPVRDIGPAPALPVQTPSARIETVEDIIADLDQALRQAAAAG